MLRKPRVEPSIPLLPVGPVPAREDELLFRVPEEFGEDFVDRSDPALVWGLVVLDDPLAKLRVAARAARIPADMLRSFANRSDATSNFELLFQ